MSTVTVTPYDPNQMVKFLHNFPHIASKSRFNQESKNYQTSIALLGVIVFVLFAMFVTYLYNLFFIRPTPRKSFFRAIHRENVRCSILIMCALAISAAVLGSVYGWRMSVKGLDGMIDDIDNMSTLANTLAKAGGFVVIGASEVIVALEQGLTECPELAPIITNFNSTFLATTTEFSENTEALPDLLDTAKPRIRRAIRYVKASLLVPLLLTAVVCVVDVIATMTNSPRIHRVSRIAVLLSTLICALIVGSEVSLTVISGDFCHHADSNAVNLIGDVAGTNSTTYQTAEYYAFCETQNPSNEDLTSMINQLNALRQQIYALPNCTEAKNPSGDIMDRIMISQQLAALLMRRTTCQTLHPVWVSLIHDHFCDKTVPGVAWLWMDHMFCMVVLCVVAMLGYDMMLSFRRSLVFSSRSSRGDKIANAKLVGSAETTPLYSTNNNSSYNDTSNHLPSDQHDAGVSHQATSDAF